MMSKNILSPEKSRLNSECIHSQLPTQSRDLPFSSWGVASVRQ